MTTHKSERTKRNKSMPQHQPQTISIQWHVRHLILLCLMSTLDAFHLSNFYQCSTGTTYRCAPAISMDVLRRRKYNDMEEGRSNIDRRDDTDYNVRNERSYLDDDDDDENYMDESTTKSTSTTPKSHFFSQKSIKDPSFRIIDRYNDTIFHQLCQNVKIDRPSKIQSMAWPILLQQLQQSVRQNEQSSSVVIAEQTGSGKTLAYLIPLIQHMIHTKKQQGNSTITIPNSSSNISVATPKLLILTPTAELADQIRNVCYHLSGESNIHTTKKSILFKTIVLTATGQHATNIRDQVRLLQQNKNNIDIIISTPGRIATILRMKHSSTKILDLQYLQCIVMDEVDVLLLDKTFGPQLQTIGEASSPSISSSSSSSDENDNISLHTPTQFVFVTATLPDSVLTQIKQQFPNTIAVKGPGLHRVPPTVIENLIDVSAPSSVNRNLDVCFNIKANALQKALRSNRCQRTLIFCNTISTCRQVENLLYRIDRQQQIYTVRAYHNAMTAEARNANLEYFAKGSSMKDVKTKSYLDYDDTKSSSLTTANTKALSYVLVCTDRAGRGIDFDTASIDHVILFDFPNDPAEYVRRVGRTARAGRSGTTTILAYGWQLPIARSIIGQQSIQSHQQSNNKSISQNDEFATTSTSHTTKQILNNIDNDIDNEYMGGVQGRRKSSLMKQRNNETMVGIKRGRL
jgi:ATP-dependent RNA helicase DDX18/HAS1